MSLWRFPICPLACLFYGLAMFVPMLYALATGDERTARAFFLGAAITVLAFGLTGIPFYGRTGISGPRSALLSLILFWVFAPMLGAVPFFVLAPHLGFVGAYFEMVSFTTTTTASQLETLGNVPPAFLLWRALACWIGGFVTLTAGFAILEPLNLGGFEIERARDPSRRNDATVGRALNRLIRADQAELGVERTVRAVRFIAPIYVATTGLLTMLFLFTGTKPSAALAHSMGLVSTGAVTIDDAGFAGQGSAIAELVAFAALLLVATRAGAMPSREASFHSKARREEMTLLAVSLITVTSVLYLRHWIAAIELDQDSAPGTNIKAIWGALFMSLSFLTTTGYESSAWEAAREWTGLSNPGLILLGLAAMGGGAATTAGGIKLLRIAVLFRHTGREIDRLAHPHSVSREGAGDVSARRQGVLLAWVFLMLFILSLTVTAMALALTGLTFDQSILAAVAALANIGAALEFGGGEPVSYATMSDGAKLTLCAAMVVGRVETLALVTLLNPAYWRR